ncbi:DNA-binding domain-containing protein [Bradyrhizobium sp. HKCCYLRH1073]|uniref:DNA-binding domain-containing protein n=1 Tax=unclassified Bradyrhizobium TaxID=2631580 RepID=UPI0028E417CF|nr:MULTISPECIES: DNA-binding domain-containing protein [unclassified Bradyrhizobium]
MPQPEHMSDYAAQFAAALLTPDRATPVAVRGPLAKAAGRRFNVYRNNVTVSLIESLVAIYPAVQRITGPDFFRAMARAHMRETPPTSPLLFDYGRDFPAFISAYEHARTMPFLTDVAQIERAWLDAYHAADAAPLDGATLATVRPERLPGLRFAAHPATRIVRSDFAAVTIFSANRGDAPVPRIDGSVPEDALITRPAFDVAVRHLPRGGAIFASRLITRQPLGVAAEAAFEAAPEFDLATNIAGLIEAGAFTDISFEDA